MKQRDSIVPISCVAFVILMLGAAKAQISCNTVNNMLAEIPTITVAGLPVCNAGNNGSIYLVTNALLPTVLGIVVGGGAVSTLVHCNGTNFIVG